MESITLKMPGKGVLSQIARLRQLRIPALLANQAMVYVIAALLSAASFWMGCRDRPEFDGN